MYLDKRWGNSGFENETFDRSFKVKFSLLYLLFGEDFLSVVVHSIIVLMQTKLGAVNRPLVQPPLKEIIYKLLQLSGVGLKYTK